MNKNSSFLFVMLQLIFGIIWRFIASYMFALAMVKAICNTFM